MAPFAIFCWLGSKSFSRSFRCCFVLASECKGNHVRLKHFGWVISYYFLRGIWLLATLGAGPRQQFLAVVLAIAWPGGQTTHRARWISTSVTKRARCGGTAAEKVTALTANSGRGCGAAEVLALAAKPAARGCRIIGQIVDGNSFVAVSALAEWGGACG